jgi:hypothetical protein
MSAICPGQDTRYWRPDDIFEIECGSCGAAVEFFKDDVHRRCHRCGALVQNPKITLGCAQWCEHAKECLGYDPKELLAESSEGASLFDRLLAAVKRALAKEPQRLARRIATADEVEALLRTEKVERKVALAAALVEGLDEETLTRLLDEAGLDKRSASDVEELATGATTTSAEARLLADAARLLALREALEASGGRLEQPPDLAAFATDGGRARASTMIEGASVRG